VSRGFVSALFGIAVTIAGWFSPWSWPAWPALAVLDLFSRISLTYAERAAVVVVCIVVNVAAWALAAVVVWSTADLAVRRTLQ
jgi:hypothetical protein